ncbi:MAG: hypothetical protein R2774_09035 [Saprospiraceae bacterium]
MVVNPLPVVEIFGDTEICQGETTTFIAIGGSMHGVQAIQAATSQ